MDEESGLTMTEDGTVICLQCRREPEFCICHNDIDDPGMYVWDIDFGPDG